MGLFLQEREEQQCDLDQSINLNFLAVLPTALLQVPRSLHSHGNTPFKSLSFPLGCHLRFVILTTKVITQCELRTSDTGIYGRLCPRLMQGFPQASAFPFHSYLCSLGDSPPLHSSPPHFASESGFHRGAEKPFNLNPTPKSEVHNGQSPNPIRAII